MAHSPEDGQPQNTSSDENSPEAGSVFVFVRSVHVLYPINHDAGREGAAGCVIMYFVKSIASRPCHVKKIAVFAGISSIFSTVLTVFAAMKRLRQAAFD